MGTRGIPDSSSVVIPRLICREPAAAVEFCTRTFNAVTISQRPGADGKVAHALLTIGPAMIMIEGEWPTLASRAPTPDGSSPVVIFRVRRRRRRDGRSRDGRWRADPSATAGSVLGRSRRLDHGPVRARVDDCHSHRGHHGGAAGGPVGRGVEGIEGELKGKTIRAWRIRWRSV